MDELLQFIIPRSQATKDLEYFQPFYEWDGVKYPQGVGVYRSEDIELLIDEEQSFIKTLLPNNYLDGDWIWLRVSDAVLDTYESAINSGDENYVTEQLESLIDRLFTKNDRWVMIFLLHYDQIDEVYKSNSINCINKLRTNLDRSSKKHGFIIYG